VLELQGFSTARFYGDEATPDPTSDVARMERVKNYAGAWNLVHALLLGDRELRARFNRYLRELARGRRSPADAWAAELAPARARIERAYRRLLPETTRTVAAVPFSPPPTSRPFLQPLSDADVRLLFSSVRRPSDPRQASLAAADVDSALALEPRHTDARFISAFQRLLAGDLARVRTELAAARALAPDDPRGLQLELMVAIVQRDDALAAKHARALSRRAATATQHALLAAYHAATGDARAAIRFARRGIRIDPTCWRCFSALADADVALGDLQPALVAQATAVNLLAEEDPRRPRQRQRLVELEQKLFALR
jgi:tetratricopeptide (TPR) repeat protein